MNGLMNFQLFRREHLKQILHAQSPRHSLRSREGLMREARCVAGSSPRRTSGPIFDNDINVITIRINGA